MPASSTNPSLVALLLTIRTRSGPRFVFHYPAIPEANGPANVARQRRHRRRGPTDRTETNDTRSVSNSSATSESESCISAAHAANGLGYSDTDDKGTYYSDAAGKNDLDETDAEISETGYGRKPQSGKGSSSRLRDDDAESKAGYRKAIRGTINSRSGRFRARTLKGGAPEYDDEEHDEQSANTTSTRHGPNKNQWAARERQGGGNIAESEQWNGNYASNSVQSWEQVLGYSTEGLEKLLCPSTESRKHRFEVQVGDLVFLGHPVFLREDGLWRKEREAPCHLPERLCW